MEEKLLQALTPDLNMHNVVHMARQYIDNGDIHMAMLKLRAEQDKFTSHPNLTGIIDDYFNTIQICNHCGDPDADNVEDDFVSESIIMLCDQCHLNWIADNF